MSYENVETLVRAALDSKVDGITESSLHGAELLNKLSRPPRGRARWLLPAIAAAATVVAVAVLAGTLSTGRDHQQYAVRSGPAMTPLTGKWLLSSGTLRGRRLTIPTQPIITVAFPSNTSMLIDDGVNTTVADISQSAGSIEAKFHSTTYILDGTADAPGRRAVLELLDSLAPSGGPIQAVSDRYSKRGQSLTIDTPVGQLGLTRAASPPAAPGATSTTAQADHTPAAPIS